MGWLLIVIIYCIIVLIVCLRIVYDTRSSTKTMAYLLVSIFLPVAGIVFYLVFGINFWKIKRYKHKSAHNKKLLDALEKQLHIPRKKSPAENNTEWQDYEELASMLEKELRSPLTSGNKVTLLINGEEKFPEVLKALNEAKHHIHLEYYIYANDAIGIQIENILIKKAKEGIEVRFIYDDFGSPSINKKMERRLKAAGVEVYPFQKILFYLFANRLNYRNHRKIIIIDGQTAFTGGINVSDRYINDSSKKLFWRDTHLRIDGPGVFYLQYIFFTDWKFCCGKHLKAAKEHFASPQVYKENVMAQVVASGPDAPEPSIMFSILQAIYLSKKEILITTPYFVPGDSILDALKVAAISGVAVKLLVPYKGDSRLVNSASRSYYGELLEAGVEIYLYKKGFVHAKTLVADDSISIIGTANMDVRSFELNFEVNMILYDKSVSKKLRAIFYEDLNDAHKINAVSWNKRPAHQQLPEKLARLFSPVM